MSKLFFDHISVFDEVEIEINKSASSQEEKEELWQLIDDIVHHKVMDSIFTKLPRPHHEEFLDIFHKSPHDSDLIFNYLKSKISDNFEELLKQELGDLSSQLLKEIKNSKKK